MQVLTMGKNGHSPKTSTWISSWISIMVAVVFIMMAKQVTSQSIDKNDALLRKYCRAYKVSNAESFLFNLNSTLSNLQRQLSNPQVYYAFAQTNGGEFVYAYALCREYLSTTRCLACFESLVNGTKSCGTSDGGSVIYEDCSIRYENFGVNFGDSATILDDDARPGAVCSNESTSQPVTTFNQVVQNLLSDIQDATPQTSTYYVASTRQISTNNATVYAIGQCVKNISQAICRGCLSTAYNNLQGCLPKKEGSSTDFFCFMRYSETPFFQSNQTTNIISFLTKGSSSKSAMPMIAGVSSAVGLVFIVLALWLWYRKMKKAKTIEEESGLQPENSYSYQQLRLVTHDFGDEYRVGKGGFGEVFKAIIDDENVVAVKRLHVGYARAKSEFENEVRLIGNVQHRNLVRQLGWCIEGSELLLVLEYIPQGSLDNFLWGEKRGSLNWEKRFDIICGVARGLAHLHNELHVKIIHRDIKLNNILVDHNFQPKICDFGLARLQPEDQTHVSTKLAGTLGYMAPEYATTGHLSEKVDTYSFGIVILEIISGRRCTDEHFGGADTSHLFEHAWKLYESGMHVELIDQALVLEESHIENVLKTIEIALMCTQSPASLRPTMSEVVMMLSSGISVGPGKLIKPSFIDSHRVIHIGGNVSHIK